MPGVKCKFSSLDEVLARKIYLLLQASRLVIIRSASKNPKDLLAGFFSFSFHQIEDLLKLCKSWCETPFFTDRAVIPAILNALDMPLSQSVIRYTADNC